MLDASHNSNILTFHPNPHCLLASSQRWVVTGCTDLSRRLSLVAFFARKNCSGRVAALAELQPAPASLAEVAEEVPGAARRHEDEGRRHRGHRRHHQDVRGSRVHEERWGLRFWWWEEGRRFRRPIKEGLRPVGKFLQASSIWKGPLPSVLGRSSTFHSLLVSHDEIMFNSSKSSHKKTRSSPK